MALMGTRSSGYRTYMTYENAKNDNKEVETSFNWDINFIKKPTGVYLPPDLVIKLRILSVEPPTFSMGGVQPVQIGGGWVSLMPAQNDYTSGSFGLQVQDFIDQSVEYAFRELAYEYDRPKDRTAKPKSELLWDVDIFQLDSQDRPIKKYILRDALLSGFTKADAMDTSKTPGGMVQLQWAAGIWWIEQMNLSPA